MRLLYAGKGGLQKEKEVLNMSTLGNSIENWQERVDFQK